ncbi:hypothetical protein [Xylocopilactobacillus apis]|uniref:Uncharacterized protein n=1 Tax=Xylocopilactobacillus apis TaxID=2932183 RepID=A0AAU9DJK2_9LACO|nr:hypothetical protein [Xylocopilactobacillus apis]BDR56952.1 hypothetical protein KIMC2_15140 [Xylocopilactobacillus apis]
MVNNKRNGELVMSKNNESLQETLRVMTNSYLFSKIKRGDEQFKSGNYKVHDLEEE